MGNSSISRQFKSGNWRRIERGVNRQVLQNVETKMKVEKHYARSDFESFDDRYQNTQLYNWRKSLDQWVNIVKMYEFEIKEEMFGIQQEQFVYTEKINRFNQKGRPYSRAEGFLLIMDFLKGLMTLVEVFGLFNIDILLLGVSEDGKGKLWINENFAKNQIEEKNAIQQPSPNTEMTLVNNLIRLVSDKIYNEDFMPEVPYPWNMNMQQAVDYIKAVRSEHILFQVEKVYSDRSQFKHHLDILQQRFQSTTSQNQLPSSYQSVKSPKKGSPVKGSRDQNIKVQSEKHQQTIKNKKDPSETLSSDSNSRSRTNQLFFAAKEDGINNQGVRMQQQRFANGYQENQQTKQAFSGNYQRQQIQIPYEANMHPHPIMEKQPYYAQQQQPIQYVHHELPKTSHEMPRSAHEFQRPSHHEIPRLSHEMQRSPHQIQRPLFPEERSQAFQPRATRQIKQKIMEPGIQTVANRPQYIQRKVVKYRALNQAQLEQQLNSGQSFNKFAHKSNLPPPQFLPIAVNNVEPVQFPYHSHPSPPQWMKPMMPPMQQHRQIVIEEPKEIDYFMMTETQKLMNNVELCESVLLDQGELWSNLRDLEN